jgi:hypothetical protein
MAMSLRKKNLSKGGCRCVSFDAYLIMRRQGEECILAMGIILIGVLFPSLRNSGEDGIDERDDDLGILLRGEMRMSRKSKLVRLVLPTMSSRL